MPPTAGSFNVSIAAIAGYSIISQLCHIYSRLLLLKADRDRKIYDNRNPRNMSPESMRKAMGPADYEKYERARAAHENGNENFPLFVAAVLAGNFAGLEPRPLNLMAAAMLVMRVLYSVSYVVTKTKGQSHVRSLIWLGSTIMQFYVLIQAAMVTGRARDFTTYW